MFEKNELDFLLLAVNSYYWQLKMNCIYCESDNKDTDNYFEKNCPTYKNLIEVEKVILKIKDLVQ